MRRTKRWALGALAGAAAGTLIACTGQAPAALRIELRDIDTDRPAEAFAGDVEPGDEIVLEVHGPDLTVTIEKVSSAAVELSASNPMLLTEADGSLGEAGDGTRFTVEAEEPLVLLTPTFDAATEVRITLG